MARARNIKPGFFTNDELGELPPLARLLWIGLWTICDREGRCEDRPKKIKAEVLPYDDCDAEALLALLAERGFIERYTAGSTRCIQVVNWSKHQNPHMKEAVSTIPAPCKHGASTVQAPEEQSPSTERAGLIPDSGFRIPDSPSLIPDSVEPTALVDEAAPPPRNPCPTDRIVALYHEHLPMLSRVEVINDARRRSISARWKEVVSDPDIRKAQDPREAALDFFAWFFGHVATSAFLTGKSKDWRADIDFLMAPSKFARVVEGSYHREGAKS